MGLALALIGLLILWVAPWIGLNFALRRARRVELSHHRLVRSAKSFQVLSGTIIGLLFLALAFLAVPLNGPKPSNLASLITAAQSLFVVCLLADWIGSIVLLALVHRLVRESSASASQPSAP